MIKLYESPVDYEIHSIIQSLENTLKIVDFIEEVTVLGGEPLLHRGLPTLLRWLAQQPKVRNVTVISNGTVMPSDAVLDVMQKTGARLRISDYGKLSIRIPEIKKACQERGIPCFVLYQLWTDMGPVCKHEYCMEEMKNMFTDCPFVFCWLLLNGKLFRCAHVAHLNNLGIIDSIHHDGIDVARFPQNVQESRDRLWQLMNTDHLEGCRWCNGIKNSIQGIEPGIQEKRISER